MFSVPFIVALICVLLFGAVCYPVAYLRGEWIGFSRGLEKGHARQVGQAVVEIRSGSDVLFKMNISHFLRLLLMFGPMSVADRCDRGSLLRMLNRPGVSVYVNGTLQDPKSED